MEKFDEPSGPYKHVAVIGAGAWGTALAIIASRVGRSVTLWTREPAHAESIAWKRENERFLPGVELPPNIEPTADRLAAEAAEAILVTVPAQHLRLSLRGFGFSLTTPVVLCSKGIERTSGKFMTEVLSESMSGVEAAILSGPSFARDVAGGLPTAVTVAARAPIARRLQESLGQATFRPYASEDMMGVALGGAAKNVYAIGCGIVAGLDLGESARAALLARSFAELCRLGRALGARDETMMGLSGLGDLVLTATSAISRNFSFGLALGRGEKISDLLAPDRPLAEGVDTAPALVDRALRQNVELPVAQTVADIIAGRLAPDQALPRLMGRPLKME
jgi:glycerol-3-phosphate dehydrogenase (NAD(P)+)